MDMAEIGANIRSCRTEKDMTMEELGKAIGKSQSALADYEKGRVSAEDRRTIAGILVMNGYTTRHIKVAREGKKSSWYCIQAMLEESNLGSQ